MNLTAQFERAIALTLEGFGDDALPAATAFLTPSASCLWHGRRWRSFTLCASMRGAHWAVRPRRTRRLRPGSEGPRPGRSVGTNAQSVCQSSGRLVVDHSLAKCSICFSTRSMASGAWWPGTGPSPATSPPHSNGSHSYRTPADQRFHPSLRQPLTTRSSGTRRPPRDGTRTLSLHRLNSRHENGPPTPSAARHETSRLTAAPLVPTAEGQGLSLPVRIFSTQAGQYVFDEGLTRPHPLHVAFFGAPGIGAPGLPAERATSFLVCWRHDGKCVSSNSLMASESGSGLANLAPRIFWMGEAIRLLRVCARLLAMRALLPGVVGRSGCGQVADNDRYLSRLSA